MYGNVGKAFYMAHFYGIYGIGAILILIFSQYSGKSNLKLFFTGFLIGSITEYMISFLVEVILHTRWWNYENNILNINGRICLLYSFFWGILSIFLVKKLNPIIDKTIIKLKGKISEKLLKNIISIITIFLIIDCIATCYAQEFFIIRIVKENNIKVEKQEEILEKYNKIYGNEILNKFINEIWNDEKMIRTFPNMKIEDENGNTIYLDTLVPEVQPYYYKIY